MKPRLNSLARVALPLATAIAALLAAPVAHAASDSWNVNAAGNWADAINWVTAAPGSTTIDNTDIATFGNTLTLARIVTVDADRYIGGISFGNTSGFGFTLSGGTLHLNSGGVIQTLAGNGNHTDTISSAIVISGTSGATATITAGATSATSLLNIGALTGSATAGNTTTVTLNGSNTGANIMSGIIGDGAGGGKLAIVKDGAGTWKLGNTNTYTGGTTIKAGIIDGTASGSTLGTGAVTLGDIGGSLNSTLKLGNFTYNNNVIVAAGSSGNTLSIIQANVGTIAINGTLTLNNNLTVDNGNAGKKTTVSGLLSMDSSAHTIYSTNGYVTFSGGAVIGSGGLTLVQSSATGSGNTGITISGTSITSTSTGNLTLQANNVTPINLSATSINNSGTITNSGTGTGTTTISGAIGSNVTSVTQNSATSQLTLSGAANAFTGGLFIKAGTVVLNSTNSGVGGNGTIYLGDTTGVANSTLQVGVSAGATTSIANPISVVSGNAGTATISTNFTYTITSAITLNSHDLTVNNNYTGTFTPTSISGTGNLFLGQPGGNNTFTISGGTISNVGNVTVYNNVAGPFVISDNINNTGTITNSGAAANATTISGTIGANVQGLVQNSTLSTLVISTAAGNPLFIGDTTLTAGTLNLRTTNALKNSTVVTNNTSGTLTFGTSTTVGLTSVALGGLSGNGNINLKDTLTSPAAVALTIGNSNSSYASNTLNPTYSGVLSNTTAGSSLIKVGSNTQTLSGNNSYSGATTVTAGTLAITGSPTGTGAMNVNGGTLDLGGGGATGSLASTALNLGGGTFAYTRTGNQTQGFTTTNITGSGSAISVVAGNILNLGTVNHVAGTFDFASTGAGIVAADTASNIGGIIPGTTFGSTWAVANGAGSAITGLSTYTLTNPTTGAGDVASNYLNQNIDVDSSQTPAAAITPNSLRFNTAGAFTETLTGTTNVITSGGILVTSAVGSNLSTITGGSLSGAASADLAIIQNNPGGGLTIGSAIVNNGTTSISKSGAGLLTLTGTNTYTGATVISAGILQIGTAGSLGPAGIYAGNITNNGTLQYSSSVNQTLSGIISGSGGLTKDTSSTSTLTLTGVNTFTGDITIGASAGNLQIGTATATTASLGAGNYAGNIAIGGTLQFNGDVAQTLSGNISGNGGLSKNTTTNTRTLTLSGTNTFTGAVTFNGSLILTNPGALQSPGGTITMNNSGALNYNNTTTATPLTITRAIVSTTTGGNSNFIQNNSTDAAATLTINSSSFTGATNGVITLGGSNTGANEFKPDFGNGTNMTNSVVKADAGNWTISGAIKTRIGALNNGYTSGVVRVTGGSLTLTNATSNYTNATYIQNGTLNINSIANLSSPSAIGAPTTAVNGLITMGSAATTGTLVYTGASAGTTNRTIQIGTNSATPAVTDTGSATIRNNGSAALTFTAANLNTQTNAATGTGANRVLTLGGTNTDANTIQGVIQNNLATTGTATVALTKADAGKWVLTGNNTYTGATTVSNGTLLINNSTGSGTGTGTVSVASGATLGGTGIITGTVSVSGVLSPGASVESFVTGALTMAAGSEFHYEVDSSAPTTSGADLQKVVDNGSLTLSGDVGLTMADLRAGGPVPFNMGDTFTLISYTGSKVGSGHFTNGIGGAVLNSGDIFTPAGGTQQWQIAYDAATGGLNFTADYGSSNSFINITAIPEPRAALLGSLGLLALLRRRRR